jgi:hypothetical protein
MVVQGFIANKLMSPNSRLVGYLGSLEFMEGILGKKDLMSRAYSPHFSLDKLDVLCATWWRSGD